MKTYDETINSVMNKSDAYNKKIQRRNKAIKKMSAGFACVFVLVLTATVLLNHFNIDLRPVSKGEPEMGDFAGVPAVDPSYAENVTEPAFETNETESYGGNSGDQTTAPPIGHTEVIDGDVCGGVVEGYSSGYSPEYPPEEDTTPPYEVTDDRTGAPPKADPEEGWAFIAKKVTGEFLSDEEAAAYFAENRQSLISSLSASGVQTDNIKIMEKGYCHINISDAGALETKVNYRDYLVYNGSSLVAIVTLCKEDGKIYSTPSFGAPWFSTYNDFLTAHKGQELVYVYLGMAEYVITPDNQIVSPLGIEIMPEYFIADFDYHGALKDGFNVYVP